MVEDRTQRGLVKSLAVGLVSHVPSQPSLRTPDRLWIVRGSGGWIDTSLARDRPGGRQEPGFVLGLGQYDPDFTVRAGIRGPAKQLRCQFLGTVTVSVEKDKDGSIRPCLAGGQFNGTLQFSGFDDLVSLHTDRPGGVNGGPQGSGDPAKKQWKCLDFPMTLDYG